MELKRGKLISGKYRLERSLDAGGMGAVWVARHTQLDVDVAIKFIAPELRGTSKAEERFEREAKAEAQLKSPHIIQILDYGVHEEAPFIAMELLEGKDLGALFEEKKRLTLQRASQIVSQVAKGLKLAHDHGIVHRDLKPKNIFLARSGEDEVVKILDFGIAKMSGPSAGDATETGVMLGSPSYMSPEQAYGAKVDHRSDLWALGVVTFQAVTGERPFQGGNIVETLTAISLAEFRPPTSIAPDLPSELDGFFLRALARDPEGRFPTARAMADAFAEIAAAYPEKAPILPIAASPEPEVAASPQRDGGDEPIAPASEADESPPVEPTGSLSAASVTSVTSVSKATPARSGRRGALRLVAGAVTVGLVVSSWLLLRTPTVDNDGDLPPAGTSPTPDSGSPSAVVSATPSATAPTGSTRPTAPSSATGPAGSASGPAGSASSPAGSASTSSPTGSALPPASSSALTPRPKLTGRLPKPKDPYE
jgi:serine/threonine protein kinase